MISFPNAKINIGLHVINQRDDGFHNIESVFYPTNFCDGLEIVTNKQFNKQYKCQFVSQGLKIAGKAENNLIVKAYNYLDANFGLPPVLVYLNKHIPMGAGLGGGSSDAANALMMLNQLFKLKLTNTQLAEFAAKLGSDCPFFIKNQPAYLFGKGEELSPIKVNLSGYYLILVHNGSHSNTAMAYQHVQKRGVFKKEESVAYWIKKPVDTWKDNLFNDFENSVFRTLPELAHIKQWLYQQGAVYAAMSGSGAALFGLFEKKPLLSGALKAHVVHQQLL